MVHMDNSSLTETFTRSYFSPQSYQFRHNCLLSTPFLHNVAFLNIFSNCLILDGTSVSYVNVSNKNTNPPTPSNNHPPLLSHCPK